MTFTRSPLLLALTALVPACGVFSETSDSAGTKATASGSASDSTGGGGQTVTIYDIQQGKVPVDLVVELKNVIATSPVYFDKNMKAFMFVSEAEGSRSRASRSTSTTTSPSSSAPACPRWVTPSRCARPTPSSSTSRSSPSAPPPATSRSPARAPSPPPASSRPPTSPPWAPRPRTTRAAWSKSSTPRSPPPSSSSASSRSTTPSRSTTSSSSPPPAPSPRWAPTSPPWSAR